MDLRELGRAPLPSEDRRRPGVPRALAALVLLAVLALSARHLLAAEAGPFERPARTVLPHGRWPSQGQAAIVVLGGRGVAASPGQEAAPIASLAKVMTAYLTLERHPLGPGEDGFAITVTAAEAEAAVVDAEEGESVVPVVAGERLSERQLLEALLVPSGNNIARLLAARIAGDEGSFVAEMNDAAGELGMDATTYTDPSGFDPGTVSTAADQLRVFRQALRLRVFREIVSMASVRLPVAGTLANFNPLIGAGYGGKTGSDSAAGGCLAFFTPVTAGGRRTIAVGVVMGQGEGSETTSLLDAAGTAAEGLVASVARRSHGSRPPFESRAARS